jgi:hypothetical protein
MDEKERNPDQVASGSEEALVREAELFRSDPLLALYGSGKALWAGEHADEYVARLRAGWSSRGSFTSGDVQLPRTRVPHISPSFGEIWELTALGPEFLKA